MKKTIFRYGILAGVALIILSMINMFVIARVASYIVQEVAGYLTILLSTLFIFFGIRHYRDNVNNGTLSFGEGLKAGALIILIPALAFGLFDIFYTEVINPGWKNDYFNHYLENIKQNTILEGQAAEIEKLEKQREMFANPFMQFLLMFGTVFVIGMIVTIISAVALRRQKKLNSF